MVINVLTDVLSNVAPVTVSVVIAVFVNAKVVLVISALIDLELVVPLSYVMKVMFDDWTEAAIDIDVSTDRRVGKLIGTLTRV